ncbi:sugar transferase [Ligilactobacillus sp. LYQ139]|uniref:sugar transferase n=1 Tax=Ligilactobacillus sp. LYQ139 TaxID=3378800 RepID=UPI0038522014
MGNGRMRQHRPSVIYRIMKRCFDITISALMLVLLSPVFLIVALLIHYEDHGPALYRHRRIGKGGRPFDCLKFRSMRIDSAEMMIRFTPEQRAEFAKYHKLKDDPRITRIGNFLRNSSLDELPQLWNILIGQMSFVGPRPITEVELEQYGPKQRAKYESVLPGLTGMWQASGRNNLTFKQRMYYDAYYVDHQGIWLDIKILFKTFSAVLNGEGAA